MLFHPTKVPLKLSILSSIQILIQFQLKGWKKDSAPTSPCTIDENECTNSPCSTNPPVLCINIPGSFR